MKHALAFLGLCVARAVVALAILWPITLFGGTVNAFMYFMAWLILSLISNVVFLEVSSN